MLQQASSEPTYAPPEAVAAQLNYEELHIKMARVNPVHFNSYVLMDDETGLPIVCTDVHAEWQKIVSMHKRSLIWGHVESGKTVQISIGRVLWELGRNPSLRVAIVSNTDGQAQKICQVIGKYIERSERLHKVFPNLRRQVGGTWNMHQLTVERVGNPRDPSVQTCGIHGNILGARIDMLVMDDLLDYENTVSPTQREDLWRWYHATFVGRLTSKSRVVCVGNAWHLEDVMHRWARTKIWAAYRYPVINADGSVNWPARWSEERIRERREELGPSEFARQMMCVARSDEDARFKRDWVDRCLARGEGEELAFALDTVPPGYRIYTGVDLSVGHKNSDLCVFFTIAVRPNEDREVLSIESGRWTGPEIVDRIFDVYNRYQSIIIVENNATQEYILQFATNRGAVPVVPYTTTSKVFKNPEFGIESMAVEMANGKWIIPCQKGTRRAHPEVEAWIGEMLYYDPNAHPGDRLMASWFAREGAKYKKKKGRSRRLDLTSR